MKQRKGYVFKQGKIWIARITYTDAGGKRKNHTRNAQSKTEALEKLDELGRTLKDYGARPLDGARLKMPELVDAYVKAKIKPPEYHGDRKVSGLRSWRAPKLYAEIIKSHFARKRIKDVTPADIEDFKKTRLKTPTKRKAEDGSQAERSITSVNRELEVLRSIFAFAKREGWLIVSPFDRMEGVISKADETRRTRVLSSQEEARLVDACAGARSHIRPLLIAALDTAMRRGELLKLRWRDVDLDARVITVTAMNSKTSRSRHVGVTARLFAELERLWNVSPKDENDLVFGIKDNFRKSWDAACKAAGVKNFKFHDCRHTCITRWVSKGLPIAEIMRLSGHSTLTAFSVYVNSTEQTVRRGVEALDAWNEEFSIQPGSDLIN